MIDLDHFKRVNDEHGHAAGDDVLKALATMLKNGARESDIVCRYGGEKFRDDHAQHDAGAGTAPGQCLAS